MVKSGRAPASTRKTPGSLWTVLILIAGALLSGGCLTLQDPESFQDYHAEVIATLSPGGSVGQSLVSRRARLNGIALWLAPDQENSRQTGELIFDLYRSPEEAVLTGTTPLASVSMPLQEAARHSPLQVDFPPQPHPPKQAYYLNIRLSEGRALVYGRSEQAYPDGSAFLDGEPVSADLGFRLSYDYGLTAFVDDLVAVLGQGWLALPLLAALLLPGWMLLDLLGLSWRFDGGQRVALSIGLSLAVVPLVMLWTGVVGIKWRPVGVIAVSLLLGAIALWRFLTRLKRGLSRPALVDLMLIAVFAAALTVRLIMVRDLAAPPWVDSVHHGVITRLILDRGAYPDTYSPLINIQGVSYHSGFHSVLALFQWLSGMDLTRAMLLLGQVLNALSALSVYLLTTSLVRSRVAGLAAAFITALVTPMPAYYTSWGRYTQLAGLMILPVPLALIVVQLGEGPGSAGTDRLKGRSPVSLYGDPQRGAAAPWMVALAAGVAGGGLFLTHYRVAVFMAALLAAFILVEAIRQAAGGGSRDGVWSRIAWVAGAATVGTLLVLPWLIPALSSLILPKASLWGQGRAPPFSGFSWGFLTTASGIYALALAGVGFLWGCLQRRWFALTLVLWVALMFLGANLSVLGLPGGGLINNLSVEISLFMPVSLLGGYILAEVNRIWKAALPAFWHPPYYGILAVLGIWLGVVAAHRLAPILNPITFLFRQADRPGIAWVAEHVSPNETVLVNPFAWGYGLYAGNDGGYWISALAGVRTLPPPVIYSLNIDNQAIQAINQASQMVIENGGNAEVLARVMRSEGVRYMYIGSRGGVISVSALRASPQFEMVFSQRDVWVFRLRE